MPRRKQVEGPVGVRVQVLGATDITVGHRRIGLNTEALFALALYLTTRAGERLPREDVAVMFWPTGSDEDRRHAMRQQLYRLRQKGIDLDETGESILIDPTRVQSDLRAALDEGWPEQASEAEVSAAAAFTPTFGKRIAPAFLRWLEEVRVQLGQQHRKAAARQMYLARREARWADLERWAQSILKGDPFNEDAVLARAESAAMLGSKAIAMEILDKYLMEVTDVDPEMGKPALVLRKRLAERRMDWGMRGPREIPLIGRREQMSRLTGMVEATTKSDGRSLLLVGAPGIGKTRLAQEARAYADLRGVRSIFVRADSGAKELPLGFLRDIAQLLIELPGSAGASPDALAIARRVVKTHDTSGDVLSGSSASVRGYLMHALKDIIGAVSHERRLLIVLDDLHNADEASFVELNALIPATATMRIAWILTSRPQHYATHRTGHEDGHIPTLRVSEMPTDDTSELVRQTVAAHRLALDETQALRIAEASSGNPLFARELSFARATRPERTTLPDSLQETISGRLTLLNASQQRLIRLVALLGSEATPSRLSAIARESLSQVTAYVEILEAEGMVHVAESGGLSLHECWQTAVLDDFPAATRAAMSYECAEALMVLNADVLAPMAVWRAAELFYAAGEAQKALDSFLLAAEQLYAKGLPGEAVKVLKQARELPRFETGEPRLIAQLALYQLAAGNAPEVVTLTERVRRPYSTSNATELHYLASAVSSRAEALARLMLPHTDELAALANLAVDRRLHPSHRRRICAIGIRRAANEHLTQLVEDFYSAAMAAANAAEPDLSSLIVDLVYESDRGTPETVRGVISRAVAQQWTVCPPSEAYPTLRYLAHASRHVGEWGWAWDYALRAYESAQSSALPSDMLLAAVLLAFILLDSERTDEAAIWISDIEQRMRENEKMAQVSVLHARDRLHLQRGEFSEVVHRLEGRIDAVLGDHLLLSRATDLTTLAYAHAVLRNTERSLTLLQSLARDHEVLLGHWASNYCIELASRSLRLCDRGEAATDLATRHVAHLRARGDWSIQDWCTDLHALSTTRQRLRLEA